MQSISGAEKGEPAGLLLSPSISVPISAVDSSRQPSASGSLFTIFLTAPLQAFCLLLGIFGSDVEMVCKSQIMSLQVLGFYFFILFTNGGKCLGYL